MPRYIAAIEKVTMSSRGMIFGVCGIDCRDGMEGFGVLAAGG